MLLSVNLRTVDDRTRRNEGEIVETNGWDNNDVPKIDRQGRCCHCMYQTWHFDTIINKTNVICSKSKLSFWPHDLIKPNPTIVIRTFSNHYQCVIIMITLKPKRVRCNMCMLVVYYLFKNYVLNFRKFRRFYLKFPPVSSFIYGKKN